VTLSIEVKVDGEGATAGALKSAAKRASDVRPAWTPMLLAMQDQTRQHLNSRGGGTWPPLARSTVAKKRRSGEDPRTMRASGALTRSLTQSHAQGAVREKRKTSLEFGSSLPYAHLHQEGSAGGKIPQRKLVKVDKQTTRTITEILARYVRHGNV
jgi:phage gpG-like protein